MVEIITQNFEENKKLYRKNEKALKTLLGEEVEISHVGSTAIPKMCGKNIIDILVGVKDEKEFLKISRLLKENGYFKSERSATPIYQFFANTVNETKAGDIHIHLVIKNSERYDDFLILRDYLLKNEEIAKGYSLKKQEILNRFGNNREDYKRIKSEYVSTLIKKAKEKR